MGGFLSFFVCVSIRSRGKKEERERKTLPRDSLESRRRTKERKKEKISFLEDRGLVYHTLIIL